MKIQNVDRSQYDALPLVQVLVEDCFYSQKHSSSTCFIQRLIFLILKLFLGDRGSANKEYDKENESSDRGAV